jgi:hypothetical protein
MTPLSSLRFLQTWSILILKPVGLFVRCQSPVWNFLNTLNTSDNFASRLAVRRNCSTGYNRVLEGSIYLSLYSLQGRAAFSYVIYILHTSHSIIVFILSHVLVTIDGVRIGWLDLLTTYKINSYLQATQRYRWFAQFTVHTVTHTLGFSVFISRNLVTELKHSL